MVIWKLEKFEVIELFHFTKNAFISTNRNHHNKSVTYQVHKPGFVFRKILFIFKMKRNTIWPKLNHSNSW